ncbi:hypothetical protein [Flavobacterium sp.]|uniref:hypothetical protein n=1 Tax=Flavobacterium sp. TaxID=239 RepID=UPI00374CE52D
MDFKIETVMVKVPSGANIGSKSFTLPNGFLLGVNAMKQSQEESGVFLNVGIKDDGGSSINKVSDLRIWQPRMGGAFHDSYIPLGEETKGLTHIFEVSVSNTGALPTVDTYVQFVLYYKKENKDCKL